MLLSFKTKQTREIGSSEIRIPQPFLKDVSTIVVCCMELFVKVLWYRDHEIKLIYQLLIQIGTALVGSGHYFWSCPFVGLWVCTHLFFHMIQSVLRPPAILSIIFANVCLWVCEFVRIIFFIISYTLIKWDAKFMTIDPYRNDPGQFWLLFLYGSIGLSVSLYAFISKTLQW